MATSNQETEKRRDGSYEASSPATTLSVGSGEMKYKEQFSSIDLTQPHAAPLAVNGRYAALRTNAQMDLDDDPFTSPSKRHPSFRKPLPPQPKESPFRPAILNFGLRSRSKTYDPVSLTADREGVDVGTPSKPTFHPSNDVSTGGGGGAGGFLSGLGISGVWKAVTSFATPKPDNEDEESFVGRPYRPYSEVMSESDTPYTPTKAATAAIVYDQHPALRPPRLAMVWRGQERYFTSRRTSINLGTPIRPGKPNRKVLGTKPSSLVPSINSNRILTNSRCRLFNRLFNLLIMHLPRGRPWRKKILRHKANRWHHEKVFSSTKLSQRIRR